MMIERVVLSVVAATLFAVTSAASAAEAATTAQLYTLDCGHAEVADMGDLFDTFEHVGETGSMAAPCFLIHHGGKWMLWDTGIGDRYAGKPGGVDVEGFHIEVRKTLRAQLRQLGLEPDDIDVVALSHLHWDHAGNIGMFAKSKFLVSSKELAWARGKPAPGGVDAQLIAPLAHVRLNTSPYDLDVFGDGSVMILEGPGHTPGHRFLLVRLAHAGPLLISGDLFHTREAYQRSLVPQGNWSRAETLASMNRFAGIRDNLKARVVVQHSVEDFESMPSFPSYLD